MRAISFAWLMLFGGMGGSDCSIGFAKQGCIHATLAMQSDNHRTLHESASGVYKSEGVVTVISLCEVGELKYSVWYRHIISCQTQLCDAFCLLVLVVLLGVHSTTDCFCLA
jgi:hypothetical protein